MSETKDKIEIIPANAIITIEVGGGLYARIHQLMLDKAAEKTPEEFTQMLEYLKTGKPRDKYEYTIETYLSILYQMEVSAKAQGKTEFVDASIFNTSQN